MKKQQANENLKAIERANQDHKNTFQAFVIDEEGELRRSKLYDWKVNERKYILAQQENHRLALSINRITSLLFLLDVSEAKVLNDAVRTQGQILKQHRREVNNRQEVINTLHLCRILASTDAHEVNQKQYWELRQEILNIGLGKLDIDEPTEGIFSILK